MTQRLHRGTILDVTRQIQAFLERGGREPDPWQQSKAWVQEVCGLTPVQWACHLREPCTHMDQLERYLHAYLQAYKPLSRSLGRGYFWKGHFVLNQDTLDPRPETEGLVERIVRWGGLAQPGSTILDLGTGTGCILLSVLEECPLATGVGVDISPGALQAARENGQRKGLSQRVEWVHSCWFHNLVRPQHPDHRFHCIVSNPPYVSKKEMACLPPEVYLWDPHGALEAEDDGLAVYGVLLPQARAYLRQGGLFLMEIGAHQGAAIAHLARTFFRYVEIHQDLCGRDRYCLVSNAAIHLGNGHSKGGLGCVLL